jgi:hypothetical protein
MGSIRPRTNQKHPALIKTEDTTTQTSASQPSGEQTTDKNAIRPFHVDVPEAHGWQTTLR